ncbi:MAG: chromate efflux transporter [Rudaea sp.]
METATQPIDEDTREVSLAEAARVWAKIGWLGFGGPAGQIALMHHELVERRRWISDERFLHALNYCMLLPGPEAQQLATYIGWLMHRTRGGIIAGTLFVLPGILVIGVLSGLYAAYHQLPFVAAVFFGIKAAVLAVVVEALLRIARRALRNGVMVGIAAASFLAICFLRMPFPLIVLGAMLAGIAGRRLLPRAFPAPESSATLSQRGYLIDRRIATGQFDPSARSLRKSLGIGLVCVTLWFSPLAAVTLLFGPHHVLTELGVFFSETAVVTFGGAYAVLAFIAQRAVDPFGWLAPGEMLDGLALAETTPGPLIMVVQFVAFLAAFRHPGSLPPYAAAILGALLTTWVTFVPCFMWILVGAPYIEKLRSNRALHAALSSVTAAIVGVILNLSVWFALRTIFHVVAVRALGPMRIDVPAWTSLDPAALLLTIGALIATLRYRLGLGWLLAGSAAVGLLLNPV